jgi:anti-sigma28 factor (negative regulator of flagellin synthesis)
MSIKGIGSPGFRPLEQPKKAKKNQQADFKESLKKTEVKKDSAEFGNNIKPSTPDYSRFQVPAKRTDNDSVEVGSVVKKVMEQPEQVNERVQEIKKLIDEGGYQAYFKTVDSEKVAERLLGSGQFDDLV